MTFATHRPYSSILKLSWRSFALPLIAFIAFEPSSRGEAHSIDISSSKLLVHAFKSGLFSGFADNHAIEAPISEGTVDEAAAHIRLVVDSRRMRVLDPQLAPDKRRQVQERMLGPEVLDSTRFPQIVFESKSVEQAAQGQFLVKGQLSLRGVTQPFTAMVRRENGRYLGICTLKQRDFGIPPISIAGGTVKVKNELKIDFDIGTSAQTVGKER